MPPRKRRLGVVAFLSPIEGLQARFDSLESMEAAKVLCAELEAEGFDAAAELRRVDRRPRDLYRRLLV